METIHAFFCRRFLQILEDIQLEFEFSRGQLSPGSTTSVFHVPFQHHFGRDQSKPIFGGWLVILEGFSLRRMIKHCKFSIRTPKKMQTRFGNLTKRVDRNILSHLSLVLDYCKSFPLKKSHLQNATCNHLPGTAALKIMSPSGQR